MSIKEDYADSLSSPEDYDDPEFLKALMDPNNELNESFEAFVRLTNAHNGLVKLLEASQTESPESFESMVRSELNDLCRGTGLDPNTVVLSNEGIGSTIMRVGRAILEALKKFFKMFLVTMSNVDLSVTWMRADLKRLEKHVAIARGKSVSEQTVTMGRNYRFLRYGALYADESIKLERELKTLSSTIRVLSTDYLNQVMDASTRLPSVAQSLSGNDLEAAMVGLVNSISFDSMASKMSMISAPSDRFNGTNVLTTGPLLGGKSVFYFKQDLRDRGVRGFRFHGFLYENTGREEYRVVAERQFPTLNPAQIGKIPSGISEILDLISKQTNVVMRSRISRTQSALERYASTISTTPMSAEDVMLIRKTVLTLVYWMRSPVADIYATSLSVCRAAVTYCKKSVHTYR